MSTNELIDPIQYGVLWAQVQELDRKMSKMEVQLDHLISLADRGKGGLWFGMSVIALLSSLAGFLGAFLKLKGD